MNFLNLLTIDVLFGDCLRVLLNLLENEGNQSYFHQRSYIESIFDFFGFNLTREKRWPIQRVTNIHLSLKVRNKTSDLFSNKNHKYPFSIMYIKIIRTFVSPTNSPEHIVECQTTIEQCGKKRIKRKYLIKFISMRI